MLPPHQECEFQLLQLFVMEKKVAYGGEERSRWRLKELGLLPSWGMTGKHHAGSRKELWL